MISADDKAVFGVVFDEAAHEGAGGEVGLGGGSGDLERREAAPEIEGVGEFVVPDFFGEEDLGFERGLGAEGGVAPAEELAVLDDVVKAGGIEDEDFAELMVL
jgi:hypothetical protein